MSVNERQEARPGSWLPLLLSTQDSEMNLAHQRAPGTGKSEALGQALSAEHKVRPSSGFPGFRAARHPVGLHPRHLWAAPFPKPHPVVRSSCSGNPQTQARGCPSTLASLSGWNGPVPTCWLHLTLGPGNVPSLAINHSGSISNASRECTGTENQGAAKEITVRTGARCRY